MTPALGDGSNRRAQGPLALQLPGHTAPEAGIGREGGRLPGVNPRARKEEAGPAVRGARGRRVAGRRRVYRIGRQQGARRHRRGEPAEVARLVGVRRGRREVLGESHAHFRGPLLQLLLLLLVVLRQQVVQVQVQIAAGGVRLHQLGIPHQAVVYHVALDQRLLRACAIPPVESHGGLRKGP